MPLFSSVRQRARHVALAAAVLAGAPSASHAVSPVMLLAATLQPETMYLGFIVPVTSKEFLGTLGLVINHIPFFGDYYAPVEEWVPRARTWSINPPAPINPPFRVPPAHDPVFVPNNYSQIIAFGDSMSDMGNLFRMTQAMTQVGMPVPPSNAGRFSNGVVALDVLANQLRLPLTNYCFSGGQTGKGNLLPFWSWQKGMLFQVEEFHKTLSKLGQSRNDPNALYFLWAGPNDFYEGINMYSTYTAKRAAANHLTALRSLYNRGSRQFLIPLMPDLSSTPQAAAFEKSDPGYMAAARRRSDEYRTALLGSIAQARQEMPDIKIRVFDTLEFLRTEMPKAAAEGVNVTDSCYSPKLVNGVFTPQVCADPDNYLFWDKNHPTDRASRVLGAALSQAAVAP